MSWLFALACTGQPAAPSSPSLAVGPEAIQLVPACQAYGADAEEFGYCAYQRVEHAPDAATAKAICALAGPWAEDCAETWSADTRRCELPLDELLGVCGEDPCRFAVLDACPSEKVLVQVQACERNAGRFERDCVGHALQRWLTEGPAADEAGQLMALRSHNASVIGAWAGLAMVRLGEGSCEDPPGDYEVAAENRQWCQSSVDKCAADPGWCSKHWKKQGGR